MMVAIEDALGPESKAEKVMDPLVLGPLGFSVNSFRRGMAFHNWFSPLYSRNFCMLVNRQAHAFHQGSLVLIELISVSFSLRWVQVEW
jgi:hypothetical protein